MQKACEILLKKFQSFEEILRKKSLGDTLFCRTLYTGNQLTGLPFPLGESGPPWFPGPPRVNAGKRHLDRFRRFRRAPLVPNRHTDRQTTHATLCNNRPHLMLRVPVVIQPNDTRACAPLPQLRCGSVAEWLACWTQAQKGPGSNRSRDAVG